MKPHHTPKNKYVIPMTRYLMIMAIFIMLADNALAIDLQNAINIAKNNNSNIKLEKTRLNLVKNEQKRVISEFLPNVSANLSIAQRSSYYQGQTYDRSARQKTQEIRIDQPIFDGLHSVYKYRESNYKIMASDSKTADKIQEISFFAVQSYCNLFLYRQLLALYQENRVLAADLSSLIDRRRSSKIIDKAEIIKFKYEISAIEEKYLDTLNRLNKAKFDYQNVIGQPDEDLTLPQINIENFNKERVIASAIANNHNIKSRKYNYVASKLALNAEKSNFSPKISLTASKSRQDSVVYLNNQDINQKSILLNVAVPIFQKNIEYVNMEKAEFDRDAAKEEYKITKDNVTKEVNQTLEEYNFLQELTIANKNLLTIAKDRAEILAKRSRSGVEDPVEAIRAIIEANDRQINYLNTEINLIISYYKIKYFLGEI